MDKVHGSAFGVEAVTSALRVNNRTKDAALGSVAYATKLKAAAQRLTDYLDSYAFAHESHDLGECHGLAFAIKATTDTLGIAAAELEAALRRELDAAKVAA